MLPDMPSQNTSEVSSFSIGRREAYKEKEGYIKPYQAGMIIPFPVTKSTECPPASPPPCASFPAQDLLGGLDFKGQRVLGKLRKELYFLLSILDEGSVVRRGAEEPLIAALRQVHGGGVRVDEGDLAALGHGRRRLGHSRI